METKNYSLTSSKTSVFSGIQNYLIEKSQGLNLFEKVMLSVYTIMTIFFFVATLYFVFTRGFKY